MDKRATEGEKVVSLKPEYKIILAPVGDVQYNANLLTKVTVQRQTP